MSDELAMVNYISEENKRRKIRRLVFMKQYLECTLLALAYVSTQRLPTELGAFTDDEHRLSLRKYLLKDMYDGTETACYDQLRLTKRNFHDLCAMLCEKCGLRGSVYVVVEEKAAMFLLVLGHGLKMDSDEVWDRYVEANEKAAIYKNKVIHNWNEICTIYSKDHATSQGARTGAETETETQTIPPTQERDQ